LRRIIGGWAVEVGAEDPVPAVGELVGPPLVADGVGRALEDEVALEQVEVAPLVDDGELVHGHAASSVSMSS
jgi:hypothetical protein